MRVLIAGAGPAGATAALVLARAGAKVELYEKSAWPRPKTCGDGISPHAIVEGTRLGLEFEGNVRLDRALVTTPAGREFVGGWPRESPWGTTIERREFDANLVASAVAAGARFFPKTPVRSLASTRRRVEAVVRDASGCERTRDADVAVLADGATGSLARALGFAGHRSRLVALRGYVEVERPLAPIYGLFYDRCVSPGYGWIFPMTRNRANVGICIDEPTLARSGGDLRAALSIWLQTSRAARERLGPSPALSGVRGGIIPTGMRSRAKGRIFLAGDAAGVADPFTAEGIYQAIVSGRSAADAILTGRTVAAARHTYERSLRDLDRNERAARGLRTTFGPAIEWYARRAMRDPAFADRLTTDVFFPKRSLLELVVRWHRP